MNSASSDHWSVGSVAKVYGNRDVPCLYRLDSSATCTCVGSTSLGMAFVAFSPFATRPLPLWVFGRCAGS